LHPRFRPIYYLSSMKTLVSTALKFQLTIPEVVEILKRNGEKVDNDFRTKLTRDQYAIVAKDQGAGPETANKQKRRKKTESGRRLGTVKFYAEDKDFGFITAHPDDEDHFFHARHIKTEPITDNLYVAFRPVPSQRKPGTHEARDVTRLDQCKDKEFLLKVYKETEDTSLRQIVLQQLHPADFRHLLKTELENLPFVTNEESYQALINRIDAYQAWLPKTADKDSLNRLAEDFLSKGPDTPFPLRWWLDDRTAQPPAGVNLAGQYIAVATEQRHQLLARLEENEQQEILTRQGKLEGYPELLRFLAGFLHQQKDIATYDIVSGRPQPPASAEQYFRVELYDWAAKLVRAHVSQSEEADLFFTGYLPKTNLDFLAANPIRLTKKHINYLVPRIPLLQQPDGLDFFCQVLRHDIEKLPADQETAIMRAKTFMEVSTKEISAKIDSLIQETLPDQHIIPWWEHRVIPQLPDNRLLTEITRSDTPAEDVLRWHNQGLVDQEQAQRLFKAVISSLPGVENRKGFYNLYEQLKVLQDQLPLESEPATQLSAHNQAFYKLADWLNQEDQPFLHDQFKNKLAYLNAKDQLRFLRKLFWYAHSGRITLSPATFRDFTVIDLDIYQLALKHHPEDFLDISLHIVIETINAYEKTGKFLLESELLRVVLKNLTSGDQPDRKFRVVELFEKCQGRINLKHDFRGDRRVQVEDDGAGSEHLVLHFNYNPDLVSAVKTLPQRRWDGTRKVWTVPTSQLETVRQFAIKNEFRLEVGGDRYKNNAHLAKHEKDAVPSGITFCEGRLAPNLDNTSGQPFWWCHAKPCHQNCETVHQAEEWESYTLLDFLLILGFDLSSGSRVGDVTERGNYHQFIGLINRFRILLDRLYCRECDHILHPVEDSNFAHYRVVRFHCRNNDCTQQHRGVYLHHCFNRKCDAIIDSRDSKKCPNGWYICANNECGCCCAHVKNVKRKENLEKVEQHVPSKLEYDIEHLVGHNERADHFCYLCSKQMEEIANEVFVCRPCNNTYHLIGNNFKRPHRHL
jgi:cold shock CspA family protein